MPLKNGRCYEPRGAFGKKEKHESSRAHHRGRLKSCYERSNVSCAPDGFVERVLWWSQHKPRINSSSWECRLLATTRMHRRAQENCIIALPNSLSEHWAHGLFLSHIKSRLILILAFCKLVWNCTVQRPPMCIRQYIADVRTQLWN